MSEKELDELLELFNKPSEPWADFDMIRGVIRLAKAYTLARQKLEAVRDADSYMINDGDLEEIDRILDPGPG